MYTFIVYQQANKAHRRNPINMLFVGLFVLSAFFCIKLSVTLKLDLRDNYRPELNVVCYGSYHNKPTLIQQTSITLFSQQGVVYDLYCFFCATFQAVGLKILQAKAKPQKNS